MQVVNQVTVEPGTSRPKRVEPGCKLVEIPPREVAIRSALRFQLGNQFGLENLMVLELLAAIVHDFEIGVHVGPRRKFDPEQLDLVENELLEGHTVFLLCKKVLSQQIIL